MRGEARGFRHALLDAGAVQGERGGGWLVVVPERRVGGQVFRPDVLHVEAAGAAFGVQRLVAALQIGEFVEEKADVAFAQFVVGGLAAQVVAATGDGIGDARQFAVFGEQVLVAEFLRRDEVDGGS